VVAVAAADVAAEVQARRKPKRLRSHVVPGVTEEGYSVDFFDMTGDTVAVVTLPAGALPVPTPADRPAVRALSA
jgi:hypothetical protein